MRFVWSKRIARTIPYAGGNLLVWAYLGKTLMSLNWNGFIVFGLTRKPSGKTSWVGITPARYYVDLLSVNLCSFTILWNLFNQVFFYLWPTECCVKLKGYGVRTVKGGIPWLMGTEFWRPTAKRLNIRIINDLTLYYNRIITMNSLPGFQWNIILVQF